jgi:hypothetical protein
VSRNTLEMAKRKVKVDVDFLLPPTAADASYFTAAVSRGKNAE